MDHRELGPALMCVSVQVKVDTTGDQKARKIEKEGGLRNELDSCGLARQRNSAGQNQRRLGSACAGPSGATPRCSGGGDGGATAN